MTVLPPNAQLLIEAAFGFRIWREHNQVGLILWHATDVNAGAKREAAMQGVRK
jgi:hypothetical protein